MPVLERLQRMDAGGDVFTTVRDFIANLHHVDPSVIEERDQIATHDRVATHAISEAVAPSHSPPSPPALATYVTLVNVTALAILAIATMPSPHHPHTLDLLPNAPLTFPVTPSLLAQVPLSKGEFRGVQNVLTQRLRRTLEAQDAARRNAYRFRAKASQHLDMHSADNWSAERALELLIDG